MIEQQPLTEQQERKYIKARWKYVRTWVRDLDSYGTDQFHIGIFLMPADAKWHDNSFKEWQEDDSPEGRAKAIHAAYLFTVERERQIAERKKDIVWLFRVGRVRATWSQHGTAILIRERAALDDLQRGMKATDD